jgi:hypothetical protein
MTEATLVIKKTVDEFSKNFDYMLNDLATTEMWARHLKKYDSAAIIKAKNKVLAEKSEKPTISDFRKLVSRFHKEMNVKEEEPRNPIEMPEELREKLGLIKTTP